TSGCSRGVSPERSRVAGLTIEGVTRRFPGLRGRAPTQAIEPISFSVADNDFIAILGPSGCGKSTLLRIVAGLDTPTAGRVLLDEPFAALDTQTRALMQELLLSIWEADRKTVLFVTHDIDEAVFMANRVVVMTARPGRIKAVVDVALPRPRHYTVKTTPEFVALKARLTDEVRAESIRAVEMEAR